MTPDAALAELLAGNRRYVAGRLRHGGDLRRRRAAAAAAQRPIAAIVGCSDARVPPQLVFDRGPGDLFTVRVAGNVATDDVVASLEYAVAELGVRLILVLGHTGCGAVGACLRQVATGDAGACTGEGRLAALLRRIEPAARAVLAGEAATGDGGDAGDAAPERAVRLNVARAAAEIAAAEPVLAPRVAAGELRVVGAVYRLEDGGVELLREGEGGAMEVEAAGSLAG
jgi:carbonic anhydrase